MSDNHPINIADKSIIELLYLPLEGKLIPEPDKTGNIEYKLRLDKKDIEKRDNMVSQMLWRMNEGRNLYGRYEANYILGIHDDGTFSNMSDHDLIKSTNILKGIAKKANAKVASEKTYVFPGNKMITHAIIRKDYKERNVPETNLMIMGPTDVGKSSLMGGLTYGQKDDGNGFSRKLVLRHVHEKYSGATSCSKYDTIGFMGENIVNYSMGIEFNMESIYNASDRLLSLIDIPGDFVQCVKTILYSVSSITPDYIIICIPCNTIGETNDKMIDHCGPGEFVTRHQDIYRFITAVCLVYDIQPIFVLTKYDLVSDVTFELSKVKIFNIFNEWKDELLGIVNKKNETFDSMQLQDDNVPRSIDFNNSVCIKVSNITDHGYDLLIDQLNIISMKKTKKNYVGYAFKDKLFVINDAFTIPDIGTIFHGTLRYGVINVDEIVNVMCHGVVSKQKIKSIHRKTLDVERLLAGESGSILLHNKTDKIDKTAMIIGPSWEEKIITKTLIRSAFKSIKLKPQQYMLFVENSIVTVTLVGTGMNEVYEITCVNGTNFILDTDIGILKDERQNYYFVNFLIKL